MCDSSLEMFCISARATSPAMALLCALAVRGADISGFQHYRVSDLRAKDSQLASKTNSNHLAFMQLDEFSTTRTALIHRNRTGDAELHDHDGDFFIVQSGEATLA